MNGVYIHPLVVGVQQVSCFISRTGEDSLTDRMNPGQGFWYMSVFELPMRTELCCLMLHADSASYDHTVSYALMRIYTPEYNYGCFHSVTACHGRFGGRRFGGGCYPPKTLAPHMQAWLWRVALAIDYPIILDHRFYHMCASSVVNVHRDKKHITIHILYIHKHLYICTSVYIYM